MNEPQPKLEGMDDSGKADFREDVQSLKTALNFALLLMFVLGFCVNVVLWNQVRVLGVQVRETQQAVGGFENGAIQLWGTLNDYAKTHPDYAPIVQKYKQYINIASNAPAAPKK